MKYHRYATFNCQGLNNNIKKSNLAEDFLHHKLTVMMIQETHIKGEGIYEIKSSNGTILNMFNSGHKSTSYGGTGFIASGDSKATFNPISERISTLTTTFNKRKFVFISVYAPTNECTKKDPNNTKTFYQNLSDIINKTGKNDTLIIGGDFNAKTKKTNRDPSLFKIIGKYAKSNINENGEKLIELCGIHNLRITNTFFKHKPIHQTTWQSPAAHNNTNDSKTHTKRINPYRNQIDYILIRNNSKIVKITDCKSTIDRVTLSDHKPVIMYTKTTFPPQKRTQPIKQFDLHKLTIPDVRRQYSDQVAEKINNLQHNFETSTQEKWTSLTNILKESAKVNLGYKKPKQKSEK